MVTAKSDGFVFFGATGDLAYKKIFPALQAMVRHANLDIPVIGVGRREWSLDQFQHRVRDSLEKNGGVDASAFAKLSRLLRYVSGDYSESPTFDRLCKALVPAERPLYYLAIPPSSFPTIIEGLAKSGCLHNARIVVEKPFVETWLRRRRSTTHCASTFRSMPFSVSTTTSEKNPSKTSSISVSLIRSLKTP